MGEKEYELPGYVLCATVVTVGLYILYAGTDVSHPAVRLGLYISSAVLMTSSVWLTWIMGRNFIDSVHAQPGRSSSARIVDALIASAAWIFGGGILAGGVYMGIALILHDLCSNVQGFCPFVHPISFLELQEYLQDQMISATIGELKEILAIKSNAPAPVHLEEHRPFFAFVYALKAYFAILFIGILMTLLRSIVRPRRTENLQS